MKIIKTKKGILFSLIAILMSTLFIISFSAISHRPFDAQNEQNLYRFERTNLIVQNFDEYAESALQISTYKTINEMYLTAKAGGPFYNNATDGFLPALSECVIDGRWNDLQKDCYTDGNIDNSFDNHMSQIILLLEDNDNFPISSITYNVNSLIFEQNKPYRLAATMELQYTITTLEETWNQTNNITTFISLEGLPSPYALLGLVPAIEEKPIHYEKDTISKAGLVSASGANKLYLYLNNSWFFRDSNSPSFSQMMEGDFSASGSTLGINSFVSEPYVVNSSMTYLDEVSLRRGTYDCSNLSYVLGIVGPYPNFVLQSSFAVLINVSPADMVSACGNCDEFVCI